MNRELTEMRQKHSLLEQDHLLSLQEKEKLIREALVDKSEITKLKSLVEIQKSTIADLQRDFTKLVSDGES